MTDDFEAIKDFLGTENKASLSVISKDAEKISAVINKLLSISVPPSATIYHLIALNQVVTYRDTLYNLSRASDDPLRARIALEKYPENIMATLYIYGDLAKYFDVNNVVFSAKEPGYMFTVGYTLK